MPQRIELEQHYIVYHKQAEWGNYDNTGPTYTHWSNHPETRLLKAVGQHIWVVEGRPVGTKTSYTLQAHYIAEAVEPDEQGGFLDVGNGKGFPRPVKLFSQAWWDVLRTEQQNFSLGFNQIKSKAVIDGLLGLAEKFNVPVRDQDL